MYYYLLNSSENQISSGGTHRKETKADTRLIVDHGVVHVSIMSEHCRSKDRP